MKSSSQTIRTKAMTSQQILMVSLQRARQKIMNSSRNSKQEQPNYNYSNNAIQNDICNDQNNSIFANSRPTSTEKQKKSYKPSRINEQMTNEIIQSRYENSRQYSFSQRKQQKQIVASAIKVLQDKIMSLQSQNKKLSTQIQKSTINEIHQKNTSRDKEKESMLLLNEKIRQRQRQRQNQKRLKQVQRNHRISAQQCLTLRTQNQALRFQLNQQKQLLSDRNRTIPEQEQDVSINMPRKIQFQVNHKNKLQIQIQDSPRTNQKNTVFLKELQKKYSQLLQRFAEQQKMKLKLMEEVSRQKKKSQAMLSMHNQEINQNIKLKDQIKQKNRIIKQLKSKKQTRSHSNLQPNKNNMQSYNLVKIKNDELLEKNKRLTDLLKTQKQNYRLVLQQINEKEEKYTQLHNLIDKICKDLQLVDPQLLTFKIKNSVEKFKKMETERLNLLKSNSNAFMRYSVSRQSASKQRPKRKGLKMQDLLNTSSKKSNSKEQAHSRSSNRSQFRSPQAFEQKRNRIRTTNDMNIKKDTPKSINQIQKLIKQIKQVNQQIKTIKNEHRNLTVILKKQQKSNNQSYMKAQQKFDKLTQTYIQHVNKLQNLKKEKEKLSNEMNEMIQK